MSDRDPPSRSWLIDDRTRSRNKSGKDRKDAGGTSQADNPDLNGGGRFGVVPADVMVDPSLSRGARLTYGILCSHADRDTNECFRLLETLAADLGCSVRSVQNYILELERAGLLIKIGKEGRVGTFRIVRDPAKRDAARRHNAQVMGIRSARFGGQRKPTSSLASGAGATDILQPDAGAPAADCSTPVQPTAAVTRPLEQDPTEQVVRDRVAKNSVNGTARSARHVNEPSPSYDTLKPNTPQMAPALRRPGGRATSRKGPDWVSVVEWMGQGENSWTWICRQIDIVKAALSISNTEAEWIVLAALNRVRDEGASPEQAVEEEIISRKQSHCRPRPDEPGVVPPQERQSESKDTRRAPTTKRVAPFFNRQATRLARLLPALRG